MKLLLDEMLDPEIAVQLRQRGWDVEAVTGDPELEGRKDPDLLRIASGQARILVADNVSDFTRLHRDFMAAGETHGGVLLAAPAQFPPATAPCPRLTRSRMS